MTELVTKGVNEIYKSAVEGRNSAREPLLT